MSLFLRKIKFCVCSQKVGTWVLALHFFEVCLLAIFVDSCDETALKKLIYLSHEMNFGINGNTLILYHILGRHF